MALVVNMTSYGRKVDFDRNKCGRKHIILRQSGAVANINIAYIHVCLLSLTLLELGVVYNHILIFYAATGNSHDNQSSQDPLREHKNYNLGITNKA